MLEKLKATIKDTPVVKFGEYHYMVHPITDGIPLGRPDLLEEVVDAILKVGYFECDKIVTAESMGFPLAALLSVKTRVPYVFIRKRRYGFPGEVSVQQVTGYAGSNLYLNFIERGDRVVFVDDVISTGGTLRAIVQALRHVGARIVDIIIVFEKTKDKEKLEKELGLKIKTLLKVDVVDGKVVLR